MQRNTTYGRDERISLLSSVRRGEGVGEATTGERPASERVEHDSAVVTGAGLAAYCPHCREALTVLDPAGREVSLRLTVRCGDERGDLFLAPSAEGGRRAGHARTVRGRGPDDVSCPHCGASLVDGQRRCRACDGPARAGVRRRRAAGAPELVLRRRRQRQRAVRRVAGEAGRASRGTGCPSRTPCFAPATSSEVTYGFDHELAVAEAQRCLSCKKPKCIDGCPVNVDIPAFIAQVKEGDFVGAARTIKQRNALPAICGRVCPQDQQCEELCVLRKKEGAVAVGALERFVADFERGTDAVTIPERAPRTGRRVAVVGSGPAGLTLAADLVLLGHGVTVFEALHKLGGVLAYGIPEFRLPKDVVEAEIAYLRHLGVRFEVNAVIGKLYELPELFEQGYDAVYLATGAGLPDLPRPSRREPAQHRLGERVPHARQPHEGLPVPGLRHARRPRAPASPCWGAATWPWTARARRCAWAAARSRSSTAGRREEMPARTEEIVHAEQEGVQFRYLTSPVRYVGDDQGWVRQLECVPMKLGKPDASGRPRPIPMAGSTYLLDVDLVLVAVGAGPEPDPVRGLRRSRAQRARATSAPSTTPAGRACRVSGPAATSSPARRR